MKFEDWMGSSEFLIGGLAYAFFWLDESLQRSMEASGFERVSRTQSLMIIYVGGGVVRPSSLAKILGISRQAVHQGLREMAAKNILELCSDPDDKRAKIIRFSAQAEEIQVAAARILFELEQMLNKRIGAKNVTNMKQGLAGDWGDIVTLNVADKL